MSNAETTHEENVRSISRLMGTLFALFDVLTVSLLGFGYVLPLVLELPNVGLRKVVTAIAIVLLLGLMQVLLLPILAVLFGYESLE